MENVYHYLNNTLINPPMNWKDLGIDLNFDKDKPTSQVTITDWNFRRENAEIIEDYLNSGLTGGVGVFEGIPYRIDAEEDGAVHTVFNGYLDLTDGAIFSCEDSTIKAKEKQSIDWLNDVADGFTFEYLFEQGVITKDDFVFMPYVLNSVPDYKEAALCALTVFVVSQEIKRGINDIEKIVSGASALDPGMIIQAAITIVYLAALLLTLIALVKQLINLIIQPVKYHAGMKVKKLMEVGASHLGLTFKSSIFDGDYNNAVILPAKYSNPLNSDGIFGFLNPNKNSQLGYFQGTFGDLLRGLKSEFNAKVIITDNQELLFERFDYRQGNAQFNLPPIYQPYYSLNTNEFNSNYRVAFATDTTERNTIVDYTGTSYQVITRPVVISNSELVLMKGLTTMDIPFALAKRKETLTTPENIINAFVQVIEAIMNALITVVNALIKVVNAIIKLLNKLIKALGTIGVKINLTIKPIKTIPAAQFGGAISNRIGMLNLEHDYFSVPKMFLMTEGVAPKKNKVATNNRELINAKYLYNNFHYIQSFFPTADKPNAGQYVIREYKNVPFCIKDYLSVRNNNFIFDSDGQEVEIETLKWNIWEQVADIRFRKNQLYTNNLTQHTHEPTGA